MPPMPQTPLQQRQSTFQTRTATDDTGELNPQLSTSTDKQQSSSRLEGESSELNYEPIPNPYDPDTSSSIPQPRQHSFTKRLLHLHDGASDYTPPSVVRQRSVEARQKPRNGPDLEEPSSTAQMHSRKEHRTADPNMSTPKPGLGPRPIGGQKKLGTFSGVFVPTSLNVLSILMFLRFGFILGQGGVLGMMSRFHDQECVFYVNSVVRLACGLVLH
jgi:potassium/chloride transporter 9